MPYQVTAKLLKYLAGALRIAVATALLYRLSQFTFDDSLFKYIIQATCVLTVLLICFMPAGKLADWIKPLSALPGQLPRISENWCITGGIILWYLLAFLEWKQPYYFVEDDNHAQFFPTILQAMRGFFNHGVFPTWNGYQLLGVPTATLGYHALTYPITYLSYALARFVCGNEFLTLEIFAWMHFVAGYFLSFLMFRSLNIRPGLAMAAALCLVLLGFNLIAGRSWYYMLTTITWLPALGLSLAVFIGKRPSLRWIIYTGVAIGSYFHAGNVQMWCCGTLFWGLGIVWVIVCRTRTFWKDVAAVAATVLAGLAIILPLLLVEAIETKDIPRSQIDVGIASGLKNILLPWPLVTAPRLWATLDNASMFYFSGGVFIFCFLIRCAMEAAYLAKGHLLRKQMLTMCFSFLAILAFTLALGSKAILWDWLAQYPPFSKFRIPFKMLPFLTLFMITSGVLFAEIMIRKIPNRKHLSTFIIVTACGLSVYNAAHCTVAFRIWGDQPYPVLPDSFKMFQAEGFSTKGRVHPFALRHSPLPGYVFTLAKNYASVYDIPVSTGYNVLVNLEVGLPENVRANEFFNKDPVKFYHEFGVDWITVSKLPGDVSDPNPLKVKDIDNLRAISSQTLDLKILDAFYIHNADTKPMAYVESAPQVPIPYKIRTDGVDIDMQSVPLERKQIVIANFLYRHWFKAFTETGQSLNIYPDGMGRLAIELSVPAKILSIRYSPPWHYGLYSGFILMLAAIMLSWRLYKGNVVTKMQG